MVLTGCQQDAFLPEALGENLSPCLFQLLQAVLMAWLPSIYKASNGQSTHNLFL